MHPIWNRNWHNAHCNCFCNFNLFSGRYWTLYQSLTKPIHSWQIIDEMLLNQWTQKEEIDIFHMTKQNQYRMTTNRYPSSTGVYKRWTTRDHIQRPKRTKITWYIETRESKHSGFSLLFSIKKLTPGISNPQPSNI